MNYPENWKKGENPIHLLDDWIIREDMIEYTSPVIRKFLEPDLQELARLKDEVSEKAAMLAEKEALIADQEAEIARLKLIIANNS